MKKIILLILVFKVSIIFGEMIDDPEKIEPYYYKKGTYYLPKKYYEYRKKVIIQIGGEMKKEDYLYLLKCVDILAKEYKKIENTFLVKNPSLKEKEIRFELGNLIYTPDVFARAKSYNFPKAEEYKKKWNKIAERERESIIMIGITAKKFLN